MRIGHVSFDLDGTLIDSTAVMEAAWTEATEALRIRCGFAEYRRYVGLPFPRILAHLGLDRHTAELTEAYFDRTRALADRIRPMSGAAAALAGCRDLGLRTSIITSKPRRNSEDLVARLGLEVDVLTCGDDDPRGKPDPLPARRTCGALSITPEETLYVGDMVFDLQFALNAGMRFLHCAALPGSGMPANLRNLYDRVGALDAVPGFVAGLTAAN